MNHKQSKGILLQVAELGNPILRKTSNKIKDIQDKDVQSLINNLIATIEDVDGVGIAAPQVNMPIRLIIIASHPNSRYPNAPRMKPTAAINPRIISHSKEATKDWEGCLSTPGIRGQVPRFKSIRVEYTTREGKLVIKTFKDFIARIFQHEYDHLDGIIFLDRMDNTRDIITEKEYQKLIAKEKKKAKSLKK